MQQNLFQLSIMDNQHHTRVLHFLYKNLNLFAFFQYVKEQMPTNWQWDCLRICYIFKMKVLVECSTATFPYGSWRLKSINANNCIRHWSLPLFCHRFIGFNIITIFQNYGGAKRNRTADLCKPPCSALPLS